MEVSEKLRKIPEWRFVFISSTSIFWPGCKELRLSQDALLFRAEERQGITRTQTTSENFRMGASVYEREVDSSMTAPIPRRDINRGVPGRNTGGGPVRMQPGCATICRGLA